MRFGNIVWIFNQGGIFQEWNTFGSGVSYRLMGQSASKVNIGDAVDASDWTFPVNQSSTCFEMLRMADNKWVYLDQEGMYNLLLGFGFLPGMAAGVSGGFLDGIY